MLFFYKGLILLVGVFLAVEIRKVKIVSLNESRFIGMSVYGAVIVSIALTPIGFLLEESPTTQYAILGIMVLASATIILILVFVSKVCMTLICTILILYYVEIFAVCNFCGFCG